MLKDNINQTLALVERAIQWGNRYEPGTFPTDSYKLYRRKLKKLKYAMEENCSAAAYGESQVGKSYLVGSLLASPSEPLCVTDGSRNYNFVNDLNPSGGATAKKESTGIITRFSVNNDNPSMSAYVKLKTLSVADIVLLLSDSYYNDVNPDTTKVYDTHKIKSLVQDVLAAADSKAAVQNVLMEDDIYEMEDYFKHLKAPNVSNSEFFSKVAPVISHIGQEHWQRLFSILWNGNEYIAELFGKIISRFSAIGFREVVYVPFDTLLKEHGSLLKIAWLNSIDSSTPELETDIMDSDILDATGKVIASNFPKSYLSLLTAEVDFFLPQSVVNDRPFLKTTDLLDFPGARRRENIEEANVQKELSEMVRRGKVAYLFNKYSRALKVNVLMFCKDQDMNGDSSIGSSLGFWIDQVVGDTHEKRTEYIKNTNNVSPFMIVATKFNSELKWTSESKGKPEMLEEKWNTRFTRNLLGEVIHPKTSPWWDMWANDKPFRAIYPLRDFFWSRDQHIFSGYVEGVSEETAEIIPDGYPTYREDLRASFIQHPFVVKHFDDPLKTWNSCATVGNDGTKPIIADLNNLARKIEFARDTKFQADFDAILKEIQAELSTHFISGNVSERIDQARKISGEIKLSLELSFGNNPAIFGQITKNYMLRPEDIYNEVYDLVVRQVETPKDFSQINVLRMSAGIDPRNPRAENIKKLETLYGKDEAQLAEFFANYDVTLEDVVSGNSEICATWPDLVTKHIVDIWMAHMADAAVKSAGNLLHANHISMMYKLLFDKLGIKEVIREKVQSYLDTFDTDVVSNVIADSISFVLADFISNVGWNYMTSAQKEKAGSIAQQCQVELNFADVYAQDMERPVKDVLEAFDKSTSLLRGQSFGTNADADLRKLPLWANFKRWENLIITGLMYTSDIVECNQEANDAMGAIIDTCRAIRS